VKTLKSLIIQILALIVLTACDSETAFTVSGSIDGIGAQMLSLTYFADGTLRRVSSPASNGQFSIKASAKEPSLATLTLSDGTPIATLVVENGVKIKVTADLADPTGITVEGNDPSEKIAAWIKDNAQVIKQSDAAAINASIAEFIAENSGDISATALLVTHFRTEGYEHMADSLFTSISTDARPAALVQNFNAVLASKLSATTTSDIEALTLYEYGDSLVSYNPRAYQTSLLCFLSADRRLRDSVIPELKNMAEQFNDKQFRIIEISTTPDSATWKSSVKNDSATWNRIWAPGSVSAPGIRKLGIERVPYFIVASSDGAQIYRGISISAARQIIDRQFE